MSDIPRHRRLVAMLFLLFSASHAYAVEEDVRCLSTDGAKKVQLEWHTFKVKDGEWFGGYVRYKGASDVIPIVLAETRVVERPAGRPWAFRYRWLEVSGGRVSGEYGMSSQGATVYDFGYKDLRRPREVSFAQVSSPGEDGKCAWK